MEIKRKRQTLKGNGNQEIAKDIERKRKSRENVRHMKRKREKVKEIE